MSNLYPEKESTAMAPVLSVALLLPPTHLHGDWQNALPHLQEILIALHPVGNEILLPTADPFPLVGTDATIVSIRPFLAKGRAVEANQDTPLSDSQDLYSLAQILAALTVCKNEALLAIDPRSTPLDMVALELLAKTDSEANVVLVGDSTPFAFTPARYQRSSRRSLERALIRGRHNAKIAFKGMRVDRIGSIAQQNQD